MADLLSVDQKMVTKLLERADDARLARLGAGLSSLPNGWSLGDPLRVGDKVVFTGCEASVRSRLEKESERLGVRILNAVSSKTALLVSDGTMHGGKAEKAAQSGTRVVHPDVYAQLLGHLQPSTPTST